MSELSPLAHAAEGLPIVTTMQRPSVSYTVADGVATIKMYNEELDDNGNVFVQTQEVLIDSSASITIEFGDLYTTQVTASIQFSMKFVRYQLYDDGTYRMIRHSEPISRERNGYQYIYLNGGYGGGYYPNIGVTSIYMVYPDNPKVLYRPKANSTLIASSSIITWPPIPYHQYVYRTVLPEPVADMYNRYIVLSGPERSTLIWIGYRLSEQYTWESMINNSTTQYALYNYLTPIWETYDYGMRLYVTAPEYILQYQDIVGYPDLIDLTVQITMYDLDTGEYLGGAQKNVNGPITQSTSPINIIDIVGSQSDNPEVTAIAVYGLMYRDISAYSHMHLANIVWSIDPDFDTWRSSVSDWLERIFNALDQTVDTSDVEISQDMGAVDEYESARNALVVTAQNGQTINAAQDAAVQFEIVQGQISQLAPAAGQINNIADELFTIHPKMIILVIFCLAMSVLTIALGRKVKT